MSDRKPSKSEMKRRNAALQRLGEQLVDLDPALFDELDLDERLREAVTDLRRFKSREAKRRQRQYIGKLMREVDVAPIEALFARLADDERREKRLFADAERWRERLAAGDDEDLDAFATATGQPQDAIADLLAALGRAPNEREERALRRRLFRAIHGQLAALRQDR